jgi:hypothetical protein
MQQLQECYFHSNSVHITTYSFRKCQNDWAVVNGRSSCARVPFSEFQSLTFHSPSMNLLYHKEAMNGSFFILHRHLPIQPMQLRQHYCTNKVKNVKLFLYFCTPLWKRVWRCSYSSTILNLGTRFRWMVSFTPLPIYPWKTPKLCQETLENFYSYNRTLSIALLSPTLDLHSSWQVCWQVTKHSRLILLSTDFKTT